MAALRSRRPWIVIYLLAVGGLIASGLAIGADPARGLLAYLAAYVAVVAVAIGALVLLLVGYVTNARWLAPLRRVQEALALAFPMLAVLFVPIAVGLPQIYAWVDPPPELHEVVAAKRAWLSPVFFILRSAIYFAIFIVAAETLRRWSRRREGMVTSSDPETALRRERAFAAAMLPAVALALTFASVDWVMSLQPAWVSSMFPVYFFAAGFSAAIALLAIVSALLRERLGLTGHHFHALGRMLFGFCVFWVYTSYFQGFLIQIANRPNEVTFYIDRTRNGWDVVLVALVAARFVLPFFLLLPRAMKFRPRYVGGVAAIVLVGHVLDAWWLVVPSAHAYPSLVDLAPLVGIASTCIVFTAWRMASAPLVPAADPFLTAGLRYESPT